MVIKELKPGEIASVFGKLICSKGKVCRTLMQYGRLQTQSRYICQAFGNQMASSSVVTKLSKNAQKDETNTT